MMLALVIGGCQSALPSTTVAEYRPAVGPVEKPAPFSDVYVLWKWVPDQSAAKKHGSSGPKVVRQVPVQIGMSYAPRGTPVGFRRDDGQLIALAGATTQPLAEAHYTWQTLAGETQHMDNAADPGPMDSEASEDNGSPLIEWIFELLLDDGGDDHHSGKGRDHHSHEHSGKSRSSDEPKKKPATQPSS